MKLPGFLGSRGPIAPGSSNPCPFGLLQAGLVSHLLLSRVLLSDPSASLLNLCLQSRSPGSSQGWAETFPLCLGRGLLWCQLRRWDPDSWGLLRETGHSTDSPTESLLHPAPQSLSVHTHSRGPHADPKQESEHTRVFYQLPLFLQRKKWVRNKNISF